jgi:hypothetical protein
MIRWLPTIVLFGLLCGCRGSAELMPLPEIEWNPERYICYRTDTPPTIDGKTDEAVWASAPRTAEFVDIRGMSAPAPRYSTHARMLWDDEYFYLAAELEEPHVWATLRERDSVIYLDNDFELFIDPNGNTHNYFELELNAFGTEWDLMLTRPYRDPGYKALHDWTFAGLRTAVHVDGTINDPADEDLGWSVEIAIPWSALARDADRDVPPAVGDQWRVNFSRVQWQVEAVDGAGWRAVGRGQLGLVAPGPGRNALSGDVGFRAVLGTDRRSRRRRVRRALDRSSTLGSATTLLCRTPLVRGTWAVLLQAGATGAERSGVDRLELAPHDHGR